MSTEHTKLSQVKLDIQKIIGNLQILGNINSANDNIEKLKTGTADLLKNLECLPLECYKSKVKKRRKKRQNKKLRKVKILEANLRLKSSVSLEPKVECSVPLSDTHRPKSKPNLQRRCIKECNRFLKTFELLQQLHLLRGQNSSNTYKFSLKLRQLRSIWNSWLQVKLQEQTSEEINIQKQWDEVLFGPLEKTYFEDKPNLQDFIRKRQVWDSYIDGRYGSSIPIGWIVPSTQVNKKWREYLTFTNTT